MKIYIGFDKKNVLAYEVCVASLVKHATIPLDIIPVKDSENEVVRQTATRLSPLEDVAYRISALKRSGVTPERLADEVTYITDLYQSGVIQKRQYNLLFDQLLSLRN